MSALALLVMTCVLPAKAPQAPPASPDPALIRVFVKTEPSEDAGDLAARRASVRDLAEAVAGKKKTLAVVTREGDADVVLEVMSRSVVTPKLVIGLGPRPGDSMLMKSPSRTTVLRVKLTSGDDTVELANKNKPLESAAGWQSAAANLASQIDKWVATHRSEILKRRGGDSGRTGIPATLDPPVW